jgi:hypothetical protein
MKQSLMRTGPIFLGIAAIVACGSGDSTAPPSVLVGSYNAVQFVTTGGSGQTNQILAGSTLSINLMPNGSTTGHLHVAASGGNSAFDADMAGTWTQTGNSVNFSQAADSFVRNMTWAVTAAGSSWQLVGDQVFSGTRTQVTLSQVTL